MLRLSIPNLDAMLVHVAFDFLAEALQFGVLLLQLFFFGLEHGDHVEPDLNFLSLCQFELTAGWLFRSHVLYFLFCGDHLVECAGRVAPIAALEDRQASVVHPHECLL